MPRKSPLRWLLPAAWPAGSAALHSRQLERLVRALSAYHSLRRKVSACQTAAESERSSLDINPNDLQEPLAIFQYGTAPYTDLRGRHTENSGRWCYVMRFGIICSAVRRPIQRSLAAL